MIEKERKYNHAARVIQKGWRTYTEKLLAQRKAEALTKISGYEKSMAIKVKFVVNFFNCRVFKVYVKKRREDIKNNSADIIMQFFKKVHDVSKLMKVVKQYRHSGK